MGSYGVFAYNAKGVETSAIDGRSFFIDSIGISGANANGSKSAGAYIHAKINGNKITWNSVVQDAKYITGYIFVCLVEI